MKGELSGRKYLVIATISTYCIAIIGTLILTIAKMCSVDVFLATFSGLGTLVMYITKAYFDDKDRSTQTQGGSNV